MGKQWGSAAFGRGKRLRRSREAIGGYGSQSPPSLPNRNPYCFSRNKKEFV